MVGESYDPLKSFQRLREAQNQALVECDEKIRQWKKFQNDYVKLRNRLETLPHELKYDITVPISKYAFMPGKLVNTNEILVLTGDNWFVERSAKQACDMIGRRLVGIENQLGELEKERKATMDQFNWTENLIKEKSEYINIEEKLDEPANSKPSKSSVAKVGGAGGKLTDEQIRDLRKKQQERALGAVTDIKKYIKDDLQALHTKGDQEEDEEEEDEEGDEAKPDEDFQEKLKKEIENLGIHENLPPLEEDRETAKKSEKEFKDLFSEYTKTVDRENNQKISQILNAKTSTSVVPKEGRKKVQFISDELQELSERLDREQDSDYDEDDDEDDYDDDDDEEDLEGIDHGDGETEPRVSASNTCVIKINHTQTEPTSTKVQSNASVPKIDSPADIYKVFYQPKSILKTKTSQNSVVETSAVARTSQMTKDVQKPENDKENDDSFKFEPQKAFSGQIMERNVSHTPAVSSQQQDGSEKEPEVEKPSKPVSKFRANKAAQK